MTLPAPNVFDPCVRSPVTRGFVEALVGSSPPLLSAIHGADEMYRYNLASLRGSEDAAAILYYQKGWEIFLAIRSVASWYFGALENIESMLDFASGYGRVTRFLVRAIDPERLLVCEIHPDAVDFQRETFGVRGLVSTADPASFSGGRFPLVAASSFFSHVPHALFQAWMNILLASIEPGGVLMFSALGVELLADQGANRSGEIVYLPESESDRLDEKIYGTTYVTEEYVRRTIRNAGGDALFVSRIRRGLGGLQDLYLVTDRDAPVASLAEAICFPWGDADHYGVDADGRLRAEGWVRVVEGTPRVSRVALFVNNRRVALCEPTPVEAGTFRWSFEVDARSIGPDDVMSVRAFTERGLESIVAMGTLRTHPPARI
jgi:SAM-dependent methyltransferase